MASADTSEWIVFHSGRIAMLLIRMAMIFGRIAMCFKKIEYIFVSMLNQIHYRKMKQLVYLWSFITIFSHPQSSDPMKRTIFCLLILSVSLSMSGQFSEPVDYDKQTFASYAEMVYKISNIYLKPLAGFKDTERYETMWGATELGPSRQCAADWAGPTFLSKNEDCLIMYARFPTEFTSPRGEAQWEISSNLYAKGIKIDISDYLSVEPILKTTKGATETDSVFVYVIPKPEDVFLTNDVVNEPLEAFRKEHLSHCIGIIVQRKGTTVMHFKVLFSEKGFRQKDKYIKKILKNIRFEE